MKEKKVLEVENFDDASNLVFDFNFEGEVAQVYLPLPSKTRLQSCYKFFARIYSIVSKEPYLGNFPSFLRDWDFLREDLEKDDALSFKNAQGWIEEAIARGSFIVVSGEHKGKTSKLKDMIKALDLKQKTHFELMIVFVFSLLRYASIEVTPDAMREFYTCLSFEDYAKHFLSCIEATGNDSDKPNEEIE